MENKEKIICKECHGTGNINMDYADGYVRVGCEYCDGSGKVSNEN